ncbi:unnamed protein product, partial [Allacma fusca]
SDEVGSKNSTVSKLSSSTSTLISTI